MLLLMLQDLRCSGAGQMADDKMKKPISATIDAELIDWINSELKDNLKYRNKSHLIEIALYALKNRGARQKSRKANKASPRK